MGKKLSQDEFIAKAHEVHQDRYDYSIVEYVNSRSKVLIRCSKHGVFEQRAGSHLAGQGCSKCGFELSALLSVDAARVKSKLAADTFIEKAKRTHTEIEYDYSLVVYKNARTKVLIKCPEHGVFRQTPNNHLSGLGCTECAVAFRRRAAINKAAKTFVSKANAVHDSKYNYGLMVYRGAKHYVTIGCPEHGVFKQSAGNHLSGKGCPKCKAVTIGNGFRKTAEEFIAAAAVVHKNKYSYRQVRYISAKDKVEIVCPEHGVFAQEADGHLQGSGCPKCARAVSKPEIEMRDFISNIYPGEIVPNDRSVLLSPKGWPMELDVYLPELALAIEMNGVHFHSERYGKDSKYHADKSLQCKNAGIQLIHIFGDDWGPAAKNMLAAKLGVAKKTAARKCSLSVQPTHAVREFMSRAHLQGAGKGQNITLKLSSKIMAVCTFSQQLSNREPSQKGLWELTRYASNGVVIGGLSKCLKFFIQKYRPISIISYSDNTFSEGAVYAKLGFSLQSELPPDYKYVSQQGGADRRSHKANFTRSKLATKLAAFDPSESEKRNCERHGYYRIWDCGKKKWALDLSS